MDALTAAVVTMTSTSDKANNLKTAERLVRQAAAQGADWVVLPEMLTYHGPYKTLYDMAENPRGDAWQLFSSLARELRVVIFAGSWPERPSIQHNIEDNIDDKEAPGQKKVYNTAHVFDRSGTEIASYRKVHLFNLKAPDGTPIYCESDGYLSGADPVTLNIDGFKVAMAICYDLRFHEFFAALARQGGFDAVILPSAFTRNTGKDHWEVLLRARAVEHQAYVIAANQTGEHSPGKISYGHSMIVDPWGIKICDTGEQVGYAMAPVTQNLLAHYRSQLPALTDRRPEVYRP